MTGPPCMPGEVHPAYADEQWIVGWLNGEVMPPVYWRLGDEPVEQRQHIMTRRKAWAPAPYVGDPFIYVWWYGEDELGRMIGGEARIQRLPPKPWQ